MPPESPMKSWNGENLLSWFTSVAKKRPSLVKMEVYCGNLILTDENSQLSPATILVKNGKILKVLQGTKEVPEELKAKASRLIDVGNYVLMPGLVDSHV